MKKQLIITFLILFPLFITNTLKAQFTLSGEYRPRAEYRHGYKTIAEEDQRTAFFLDQRSRLNFDYENDKYQFKLVIQDVRTWGSQPQLVTDDGALTTLHEAWASIKIIDNISAKIGRQEIIYDNARIFGNVAWAQQGRSHDAVVFNLTPGDSKIDVGLAFNQDGPQINTGYYSVANSYKTFQFIHYSQQFNNLKGSFLFLNNGMQGGTPTDYKTYFSQTVGTHLSYNSGSLSPSLSFYYQGGKEQDGVTKIKAFEFQLDVKYAVTDNTSLTAGIEYMSGNDEVNPNAENNAFNPFFGTNHAFNGLMDYFYVGNHLGNVGLQDIFLKAKTKVGKISPSVDLHFFSSDGKIQDPNTLQGMSKYLGTEVDLVIDYQPSDMINFKIGYSQMFATDTMVELKGASNNNATSNWAWAMLTLKPKFFTTKKEQQDIDN